MGVLSKLEKAKQTGQKLLAQLIDPDQVKDMDQVFDIAHRAEKDGVDFIFFGGSLITSPLDFDAMVALKNATKIPTVLFPSTPLQINENADALLFLSLISSRNPEYLIGHQVAAAPLLKSSSLEIIPTGYILVGCGLPTTAEYVSHSFPIPYHKPEIAASTALAGTLLGLKAIYLDGGSGAEKPISTEMIAKVREWVDAPIIVGGGIRSSEQANAILEAGADMIVVGNGAEKNPLLLSEFKIARKI